MAEVDRLESVEATGLSAEPDPTMDRLAALVARLFDAEVGLVSLVDDHRQFFPGQHGLPDPLSHVRETPLDQSMCKQVVDTTAVLQIDEAAGDSLWLDHGARVVLGVESYLGAPLTDAAGRVLGSLCALNSRPRGWTPEDRQNLADLAASASFALQARIATTVSDRATSRLQLVADTSLVLQATLEVQPMLVQLLEIVVPQLAQRAAIMLVANQDGPARLVLRTSTPRTQTTVDPDESDLARYVRLPLVESMLAGHSPYVVADAAAVKELRDCIAPGNAAYEDLTGLRRTLVVPVRAADEVLGTMMLLSGESNTFSPIDISLACDIGRRAGAALANARAFQREREIAITLQQNLLSPMPDVTGIDLAAVYHPAQRGTEIGGDWYDVFGLSGGRLSATIGDVTGHNMDAAAAMARVLGAIRCFAFEEHSPNEILQRLDHMSAHLLGGKLATCQYVVAEPSTSSLNWSITLANAGHLPPILVTPDGTAGLVELPADPLIGIGSTLRRTATMLEVEPGSVLVLYTDGLVERRAEDIDLGIERLRQAASGTEAVTSMQSLADSIAASLGPAGSDDMAILCIRLGTAGHRTVPAS